MSNPTAGEWLKTASAELDKAGIGTAHLDALILLEDVLNKNRTHILAHPALLLAQTQHQKLAKLLKRRAGHEPMSYIRGKTEFFGREFKITPAVLEPRPESETMLELLKKLPMSKKPIIADIGTGSGALAITANLELPGSKVIAIDIDPKCLVVAQQNAKLHKTAVKFLRGDLLSPISNLQSPISVLLANLPYVPDKYQLNKAAGKEPKIAIFGGQDGLDVYRRFFKQISLTKQKPKFVLTEALPFQHTALSKIAALAGYKLRQSEDFIQVFQKG